MRRTPCCRRYGIRCGRIACGTASDSPRDSRHHGQIRRIRRPLDAYEKISPYARRYCSSMRARYQKKEMKSTIVKAPAKVNLYLDVINKRPDGYHNIETVFERIDLSDWIR